MNPFAFFMRGKWTLSIDFSFEAAHNLPSHDGKCKNLHGHSWKGKVIVQGSSLYRDGAQFGMVADYGKMKQVVHGFIGNALDHQNLNVIEGLQYPTSEVLAKWLYTKLEGNWAKAFKCAIVAVEINETTGVSCRYEP